MTQIQWTEQTWNPIVGCSIVSAGCKNCYAMQMAGRLAGMENSQQYHGTVKKVNGNTVWTGKVAMASAKTLTAPLRRKKPTMYFVNSMGDLFHPNVPDEWIDQVFAVMALCPQHTFQILTKHAERMRGYLTPPAGSGKQDLQNTLAWETCGRLAKKVWPNWFSEEIDGPHRSRVIQAGCTWPLPNVWLGVSVEDQARADERIPLLLETPAAIRFVSAEPLLGPIDFHCIAQNVSALAGLTCHPTNKPYVPNNYTLSPPIDWVICGGESGPKARPMHPDWARALRDQCVAANVPFFFKQWGSWMPIPDDHHPILYTNNKGSVRSCSFKVDGQQFVYRNKKGAGRLLDGREWNEMPEVAL